MTASIPQEIPSPIDFHDAKQAAAWVESTAVRRPYRPQFFAAFAKALNAHVPMNHVVELGSGPGQLAEHVLQHVPVETLTLVDFSDAMHALARQRLAAWADRLQFLQRDLRTPDWWKGLAAVDAVITHQAVHELRHKTRAPRLYSEVMKLLPDGGLFLVADHHAGGLAAATNTDLYMTRDEQRAALEATGFKDIALVLEIDGVTLHRAVRR